MLQIIIDFAIVVVAIGSGVASILLSLRLMAAHKIDYLNTYVYYQILLFIFGLYGLLGNLFIRKVLLDISLEPGLIRSIIEFVPFLGIPVLITAWFMFVKMCLEMVGKAVNKMASFVYFGMVLLFLLFYGYMLVYYYGMETSEALVLTQYLKPVFLGVQLLTLCIAFYTLYVIGARVKPVKKMRMLRIFAHINVLVSLISILAFYLSDQDTWIEKAYLVVFFAGQLPGILFLGYYLDSHFLTTTEETSLSDIHVNFIASYKLSKREWEIVQEICEGLTNKQISEKLFISLQTVKDHTHRIYKKTAVKNRVQLVNMIGELK